MPKTTRHGGGTNALIVTRPKGTAKAARKASPYAGWKVDKLRDELLDRELSTTGKKAELVARLVADDVVDQADDPAGQPEQPDGGDQEVDDGTEVDAGTEDEGEGEDEPA